MNSRAVRVVSVLAVFIGLAMPAAAQTTALTAKDFVVWGDFGFVGDIGGGLNSSGVGLVAGARAEMDANAWAERYDTAIYTRIGVGYSVSDTSQVLGTVHWEQAEADPAVVGLLGGQPLTATFTDYQGWGLGVGYRHYSPVNGKIKPFGAISAGFERVNEISADLSAPPSFLATAVPFYDDSWVVQWRLGGGFLAPVTNRVGIQFTLDLEYSGVLNDRSGLGTLGFERINNKGNKLSLPATVGVYVRF